jgi:hypothetical protein
MAMKKSIQVALGSSCPGRDVKFNQNGEKRPKIKN